MGLRDIEALKDFLVVGTFDVGEHHALKHLDIGGQRVGWLVVDPLWLV
jgi:hypothetical protein